MRITVDAPITMDPLITSLHEIVDKNIEMQAELMQFHQQKQHNDCFPQSPLPSPKMMDDSDRYGIPRDSFALNRKLYKQLDEDSESSDNESTAAESASSDASFASSCCYARGQPQQEQRQKRVRFATEPDQQSFRHRLAVQYSQSPDPITPEEYELLWYNQEDYRYFRKYSRKLASVAAASRYSQELEEVLEVCDKATTQDVTHCSRIANTAVRGLEIAVSRSISNKRRAAIQGVLEAQAMYRGDQDLETMLFTTSRSLSRSARLFSRILGNGDYAVARSLK